MVCPCGAVSGQQVVEGEGVYKCGAVGNYCCKSGHGPQSLHPGAAASPKHLITSHAT